MQLLNYLINNMLNMKKIILSLLVICFGFALNLNAQCCADAAKKGCGSKKAESQKSAVNQEDGVKVYYFHATRRCATCQAVESVSKEAVQEFFGDKVAFESINREEEKDNPLIKKYRISGQTLLVMKDDKEAVNLTNFAFLNARTNPDKLKDKIKSTIDTMLN